MLAASYAVERGRKVVPHIPEFGRFSEAAAVDRRDADLVTPPMSDISLTPVCSVETFLTRIGQEHDVVG